MKALFFTLFVALGLATTASASEDHYQMKSSLFGSYLVYTGPATPEAVSDYVRDAATVIKHLTDENPVVNEITFELATGLVVIRPIEGRFIPYPMLREIELAMKARHLWVERVISIDHAGRKIIHILDTRFRQNGGWHRFRALSTVPGDRAELDRIIASVNGQ